VSDDATATSAVSTEEAAPADEAGSTDEAEAADAYVPDDCDYDSRTYTEIADVPADWPETFPRPAGIVEVGGEVGFGCERQTVDMRSRLYGPDGRDWIESYGAELEAAGFELDQEYDELGMYNRTYRRGNDWISYGGDFELVGRDGEYLSLGFSLADFDD